MLKVWPKNSNILLSGPFLISAFTETKNLLHIVVGQVSAIVKSFRPTDRKKCTFVLKDPIYLGINSPTPIQ